MTDKVELMNELQRLKKDCKAVILAHNYQPAEVQDASDYVGDSFGLSKIAAETDAEVIVFCGVHFMAESAKILSPDKIVLLPEKEAGCPMANMVDVEGLKRKKKEYPEATVVTYVNSSAAVKAESDICCTSSNALQVVEAVEGDQILFIPDQNLGQYVAARTDKEIIIWDGFCATHHRVQPEELIKTKKAYPDAPVVVHPETSPAIVALADHVDSTSGILKYARESETDTLIIGTEQGLLHRLKKENPHKNFIILSPGLVCQNMKKTNLEKVLNSLRYMENKVDVPEETRVKAYQALDRMLEIN